MTTLAPASGICTAPLAVIDAAPCNLCASVATNGNVVALGDTCRTLATTSGAVLAGIDTPRPTETGISALRSPEPE